MNMYEQMIHIILLLKRRDNRGKAPSNNDALSCFVVSLFFRIVFSLLGLVGSISGRVVSFKYFGIV